MNLLCRGSGGRFAFGRFNEVLQPRLGASGGIGVDNPLGSSAIQLFGGRFEFGFWGGQIAVGDCFANFTHLGFDGRFGRPVAGPALEALTQPFFRAFCGRHSELNSRDKPSLRSQAAVPPIS